jgi:hypothetical protein
MILDSQETHRSVAFQIRLSLDKTKVPSQ